MAEYTYNNAKNASISHIFFELNCKYYPRVFCKKNFDLCLKLKSVEELFSKLQNLMVVGQQNLQHLQKFQKQAYNKVFKL